MNFSVNSKTRILDSMNLESKTSIRYEYIGMGFASREVADYVMRAMARRHGGKRNFDVHECPNLSRPRRRVYKIVIVRNDNSHHVAWTREHLGQWARGFVIGKGIKLCRSASQLRNL